MAVGWGDEGGHLEAHGHQGFQMQQHRFDTALCNLGKGYERCMTLLPIAVHQHWRQALDRQRHESLAPEAQSQPVQALLHGHTCCP